jgi:hypothetical protein
MSNPFSTLGATILAGLLFLWRWLRRRPPKGESPLEKIVELAEDGEPGKPKPKRTAHKPPPRRGKKP